MKINEVNQQLRDTAPQFSKSNINYAFDYALRNVVVHPDETGYDVYMILFKEKFYEYLENLP